MVGKFVATCRQFASANDKQEWIRDRLAWKQFHKRLRREDARNAAFDARHGTDTAEEIHLELAGLDERTAKQGNTVYRVFWEANFEAVMADLPVRHQDFTFVDIGSGKGKLLLLASHYPFKRIVGVELAPLLHRIASRNIEIYESPRQRCHAIESVEADALAYELPAGPLVCLMVNPFDRDTIAKVLRRIADRTRASDSPVYVVYANMRRVDEVGDIFAVDGLATIARRRNHIVLGNAAARAGVRAPEMAS